MQKKKNLLRNEEGFTLIEIIAVLIVLGILAAVAIPKYLDVTASAREKTAQGQIGEVKGRLSVALADYMLNNSGAKPANGADLVTAANTLKAGSCPVASTTEGDFTFICAGGTGTTQTVTITVSAVQGIAITAQVGTYSFAD
jgi:MSHA pilin protein MshA